MSKELEVLKEIREHLYGDVYSGVERRLDIIETALKDYETLKQENEILTGLGGHFFGVSFKQNKVLEIIKEKRVNACEIINSKDVREYNWSIHTPKKYPLTQEEYELLKEILS